MKRQGDHFKDLRKLTENVRRVWQDVLECKHINDHDDFFDLGGNSLLAIRTIIRLRKDYNFQIAVNKLYLYPTLSEFADFVTGEEQVCRESSADNYVIKEIDWNPFSTPEIGSVVPVTPAQQEIWTSCTVGGAAASCAYNESISFDIDGELNIVALSKAMDRSVERNDALRSVFSPDGQWMCVYNMFVISPVIQDFTALNPEVKTKEIGAFFDKDCIQEFDLVNGPLVRLTICKLRENKYLVTFTLHHIICDGWSFGVLLREISQLYNAERTGQYVALPAPLSFSKYAREQHRLLQSPEQHRTDSYWLGLFNADTHALNLPVDFSRPKPRTFNSKRQDHALLPALLKSINKFAAQNSCSPFVVLLGAFEVFLNQLAGQQDIIVGVPFAGQPLTGNDNLIGHCVNLLALKSEHSARASFSDYLKKRKIAILDAFENQNLSFGHLVEKLHLSRDSSRIPLLPVVFNLEEGLTDNVVFNGLTYHSFSRPKRFETFELFLNVSISGESSEWEWSYNTDLFKPETINAMILHFNSLVEQLISATEQVKF